MEGTRSLLDVAAITLASFGRVGLCVPVDVSAL
jgi:hypothetical protein